jgi:hypothetical protein
MQFTNNSDTTVRVDVCTEAQGAPAHLSAQALAVPPGPVPINLVPAAPILAEGYYVFVIGQPPSNAPLASGPGRLPAAATMTFSGQNGQYRLTVP